MKRCLLILTIFASLPLLLSAQHNDNQRRFKSDKQQTPRYRNENNAPAYQFAGSSNNNYNIVAATSSDMILECSVLMNVKADSYLAIFNLTQVGTTAKETDELINQRANAFIQSLSTIGITSSDVYSDMIYLIPIFEYEVEKKLFSKTYNEVPSGFEMQKNLHIRFKNANQIDDIVTLAASNEIYDLVTIDYFVKDSKAIYDSIRTQAIDFITKNAIKFKKTGLNLDTEFKVAFEKSGVIYPESQYSHYESFVSQSLDAVKNKTVTTVRKPKTVAYNKVSYADFDIVLNSEYLEPTVQYTYTLQLRYTLNKEKIEPKNNYFIIDDAGNLKQVNLPK